MTSETGSSDPYDLVLADLRAKREQIDHAIAAIESLRSGAHTSGASFGGVASMNAAAKVTPSEGHLDESAFLGMTIPEAAIKALKIKRRKLPNVEMVAVLRSGGLEMNSKDPVNTVGSVLTRRADTVGDIVKVGRGIWGLKEWYPNRSFGKRSASNGDAPEAATDPSPTEPEQPSAPAPDDVFQ